MIVKDSVDAPEREIKLSQDDEWAPNAEDLPPIIPPPGLSLERRQYLFEKIREFCPEDYQDLVCPNPHWTKASYFRAYHGLWKVQEIILWYPGHQYISMIFPYVGNTEDHIS